MIKWNRKQKCLPCYLHTSISETQMTKIEFLSLVSDLHWQQNKFEKRKTSIILQKWFGGTNEERKPTLWRRWPDLRLSEWLGMAYPLLSFGPFLPLFLICSSSFVLFRFYMVGLFKGMVVLDVYFYGVAWLIWIYEGVWRNCLVVLGVRM